MRKKNQLGILKIYAFCQKNQQRASGLGESPAVVTNQSMRIHPKSCRMFTLKVAVTLRSRSWKAAVGA